MKKYIFFLVIVIFASSLANGQYKTNKTKYDYRTYSHQIGDPYAPSVAGLTSFFIPGLGQILSGETKRGLAFLGGYLVCGIIAFSSAFSEFGAHPIGQETTSSGSGIMTIGMIGAISIDIWSIFDAIRVAKVNNLAFRDNYKSSSNIQITPYLKTVMYNSNGQIISGVSVKYSF